MSEDTMQEITPEEIKAAADKAAKIGSSKMTEQIGKILRLAEGEREAGHTEAYENMMARAMEMSQAYSIDLAVARSQQAKKERIEEPENRTFVVGQRGSGYRKKSNTEHFTDLMLAICAANDVEVLISHDNTRVFGTGMPSDLDMCERLFAILSVQMVQEADAGLKRGDHKTIKVVPKQVRVAIPEDQRQWGAPLDDYSDKRYAYDESEVGRNEWWTNWEGRNFDYTLQAPPTHRLEPVLRDDGQPVYEEKEVSTVDGRVWRANFYAAFVSRTRRRIREARKQALKDAGIDVASESSGAVAIRDKKKEVRDAFEEHNRVVLENIEKRGSKGYGGAEVSQHHWGAQNAGERAAERAVLGDEKVVD